MPNAMIFLIGLNLPSIMSKVREMQWELKGCMMSRWLENLQKQIGNNHWVFSIKKINRFMGLIHEVPKELLLLVLNQET